MIAGEGGIFLLSTLHTPRHHTFDSDAEITQRLSGNATYYFTLFKYMIYDRSCTHPSVEGGEFRLSTKHTQRRFVIRNPHCCMFCQWLFPS